MRVAMVGSFGLRPKGTMAARALPLAQALTRRGHEVRLILPPWSYPEESGRAWDQDGVQIINVQIAPRALIPLRLISAVRQFQPDVAHVFKPKAYAGLAQWLLWQQRRVSRGGARLVLDEDDWEGAGGWNEREPYSAMQKRFFASQEQWGLCHADAVTVASRALETMVWGVGVRPERVIYVPNGVNPLPTATESRSETRARLGLGDALTVLLYTRFFEFDLERLGAVLTEVFARVSGAKLLLVGQGLFGEEKRFFKIAQERGWRERIVYVGWVEMDKLRGLFAAADAAIYPFDDTLINRTKAAVKLMDLLACGVPVVADAVGQIREYIVNGETGLLVAPGDTNEFALRVVELLTSPETRAAIGACAAVRLAREYDWTVLAEQVENVYATRAGAK